MEVLGAVLPVFINGDPKVTPSVMPEVLINGDPKVGMEGWLLALKWGSQWQAG